MLTVALILVIIAAPALILRLTRVSKLLSGIGAITLCYILGFILALLPIPYDKTLSQDVASVFIALAIPLVLFSFDVMSVRKLAGRTLLSFILVIVSVTVVASCAAFIGSRNGITESAAYGGMAAGLYTGGTPNMFAIGSALLKDVTLINIANIADSIIGGIYFMLVLLFLGKVYRRFLGGRGGSALPAGEKDTAAEYDFSVIKRDKSSLLKLLGTVLLAALCLCVGVLIEILINGNMSGSLYIMITVSVLGILISFIKPVREVKGSYQVGQYLILVFSLGLSMSIDLSKLVSSIIPTFLFFAGVQLASILLHFILCRLFRVEGGIALVTIIAGIYGPPFVAPTANACGDRSLIAPGVICGTLGLVCGNLLGIGLGSLLAQIL